MNIYCVYLTVYSGNKLPPFYIGYSTIKKVKNGYNGSVSSKRYKLIWNLERQENPHLFRTRIINAFETDTEALNYEEKLHRHFNVPNNPMYINMAYATGRFGGSGKNNSQYGIKRTFSEEHRNKLKKT